MLTYIVAAAVAAILLAAFLLIVKFFGDDDDCTAKSCPHLLTMSTPVYLSATEIKEAGLAKTIDQFTSGAKHVKLEGQDCIELNIPDLLNVLVQKCSQHEREIGDIVALSKKKVRKPRAKVKAKK